MKRIAALSLSLALLSLASFARADADADTKEAKARFDHGIDLYTQGDYGAALGEFQRAYALAPYSVILYNLGLTYAALGRPVDAADAMQKVIAHPGSLSQERLARAKVVAKEQAALVAELEVETNVPGARVDVDGEEAATTPMSKPLKLRAGPHQVSATRPGYIPSRKRVDVTSGAPVTVRFDLVPTDKTLAHLAVHGTPEGATLKIDGDIAGVTKKGVDASFAVLPGEHEIELSRDGYVTSKQKLSLGDGANGELKIDLAEDRTAIGLRGGKVDLAISETAAVVSVDGAPLGSVTELELAPGPHELRVDRVGFYPLDREIDVPSRGEITIPVHLEPTSDYRAKYEGHARTVRTLAWVGVVGGAAVTGAAVAFTVAEKSSLDSANAAVVQFNQSAEEGQGGVCDARSPDYDLHEQDCAAQLKTVTNKQSSARVRYDLGWAGVGLGGAILVTGVVLFAVGDDPHRYDHKSTETLGFKLPLPIVAPERGGATFGFAGRF